MFFLVCFLKIVVLVAKAPREIFNAFAVFVDLTPSHEISDSSVVCFHGWFYSELPGLWEI